jgi:hypothetical protein
MTINRYAIIDNNKVTNIIKAEPSFVSGLENYILIDNNVGVGYDYFDGIFTRPIKLVAEIQINRDNYIKLYDSFLISTSYQKIRAQAFIDLAVTVTSTEIIAALNDAKYGNANIPAIQACINNLLTAATLDETDFAEIGALFVESKLNTLYTLPTPE